MVESVEEEGMLFRDQGGVARALGGSEELPVDWDTTAEVLRETVKKVLTVLYPLDRERGMRK